MRWCTYFPQIQNIHLTKDLGLLPFYMQEVCGYDATLIGHFSEKEYAALNNEVKGLKTINLDEKGSLFFADRAFMEFLKNNSKEIDVLNLYHLSRHSLIYGILYKRHNPAGKLYLKLDAYNDHLTKRKKYSKSFLKNYILNYLEKRFFSSLDLISIENKKGLEIALKTYPEWKGKLIYLPNGCNDLYLKKHFNKPFKKERTILSVGRPGSPDKNYELLLKALPLLKLIDWKMEIIGPVSEEFNSEWQNIRRQFPQKAINISFPGPIYDRAELYKRYQRASVFFLPSRTESFGIAFAEALYFGNILVGHSGMSAYSDLANADMGIYFEDNDPASFAQAVHAAMLKSDAMDIVNEISHHCAENFYWSRIVKKFDKALQNV